MPTPNLPTPVSSLLAPVPGTLAQSYLLTPVPGPASRPLPDGSCTPPSHRRSAIRSAPPLRSPPPISPASDSPCVSPLRPRPPTPGSPPATPSVQSLPSNQDPPPNQSRAGGPGFQPTRSAQAGSQDAGAEGPGLSPWQRSHQLWTEAGIEWERRPAPQLPWHPTASRSAARSAYARQVPPPRPPAPPQPEHTPWPEQASPWPERTQ